MLYKKYAFTLIELIVVISIISLLIAILLPVLKNSRRTARDMVCASNARSISIAVLMYVDDNDGWAPLGNTGFPFFVSWANVLTSSGYTPGGETAAAIAPQSVYICPSQPNPELPWGLPSDPFPPVGFMFGENRGNRWMASHYAINSFYTVDVSPALPQMRVIETKNPSRTFLIGDASDQGGGINKYPGYGILTLSLRHGAFDRCNMAMVDSHVEILGDREYTVDDYKYWTGE